MKPLKDNHLMSSLLAICLILFLDFYPNIKQECRENKEAQSRKIISKFSVILSFQIPLKLFRLGGDWEASNNWTF
jgi:hypothetical protein